MYVELEAGRGLLSATLSKLSPHKLMTFNSKSRQDTWPDIEFYQKQPQAVINQYADRCNDFLYFITNPLKSTLSKMAESKSPAYILTIGAHYLEEWVDRESSLQCLQLAIKGVPTIMEGGDLVHFLAMNVSEDDFQNKLAVIPNKFKFEE